jgi:hypothetical protein
LPRRSTRRLPLQRPLKLADSFGAEGVLEELQRLLLAALPCRLLVDHLVERLVARIEPLVGRRRAASDRAVVVRVVGRLLGR